MAVSAGLPSDSGKRRDLALRQCSEHVHQRCFCLLLATPSLPPCYPVLCTENPYYAPRDAAFTNAIQRRCDHCPPLRPLPLCASCRRSIAEAICAAGSSGSQGQARTDRVPRASQHVFEFDSKWEQHDLHQGRFDHDLCQRTRLHWDELRGRYVVHSVQVHKSAAYLYPLRKHVAVE